MEPDGVARGQPGLLPAHGAAHAGDDGGGRGGARALRGTELQRRDDRGEPAEGGRLRRRAVGHHHRAGGVGCGGARGREGDEREGGRRGVRPAGPGNRHTHHNGSVLCNEEARQHHAGTGSHRVRAVHHRLCHHRVTGKGEEGADGADPRRGGRRGVGRNPAGARGGCDGDRDGVEQEEGGVRAVAGRGRGAEQPLLRLRGGRDGGDAAARGATLC